MKLKKKIDKAAFETLTEAQQALYIEDGEGYKLDVEGDEDTGALKRAKDRESQLRRDAEKKAKELQDQLDEIESNNADNSGDVKLLQKSYEAKLEKQKIEYETKVGKLTSSLNTHLVDNAAMAIANKISKSPKLIIPHIKARLKADLEGDSPVTRVLDAEGNVSVTTLAELEAEFVANPDFSAIIIASQSSGGAGNRGANTAGGTEFKQNPDKPADINAMSNAELVAHLRAQKAAQEQE